MTQAIKRFTRLDNTSKAISEIRKNGVIVIENLFEPDVMNMFFNHLRPSLDSKKPGAGDFFEYRKRSINGIFGRGREFSEHLLLVASFKIKELFNRLEKLPIEQGE